MRRKSKPHVRNNLLVIGNVETVADNPIQIGSRSWYTWLADHHGFIYEGGAGHFTARREFRKGIGYWYGYRRRDGKLSKTYLGKSEDLTQERLEQASARLAGQMAMEQPSSNDDPADLAAANPQDNATTPSAGALTGVPSLPLTKVKAPTLPQNPIARPRLTQRIDTPVTLVCAPSGFGKSTVLNEWRQGCGKQVAWVTLDADDNDPLRFWSAVVMALQTVNSSVGQNWLSHVHTSSPSALSKMVINLTNDIVRVTEESNASPCIGLVLDDYHHIQNTEIHSSLQTWLDHMPPKLQLAIASHTKPPLALSRLRAQGMVVELGANDLRFTLEEGIGFLSQHTTGLRLAYSEMQTLVKRTEGWVAGLVLATCALTQQEDHARFMETFTGAHTFLRNFFTEHVLHRQPPEVQTFLLKTSILKHLTGPLCNAVTGQSGGTKMLARLWEENLFITRLERLNWYRYHGLFAEMLHTQLQELFPTEIPRLHRRAANWYSAKNAPADAVYHLLVSEAWREAAALIESVALNELKQFGEGPRLLRWLQQLPEAVLQQHRMLLMLGIRLAKLSLPSTEMERTKAAQETLPEIQQIGRSWVTDNPSVSELPPSGAHETVCQMMDDILQFQQDYRRDLIQAETKASAVYETAQANHHLFGILIAGGACANLALSRGHLRRSEQIAHQVLRQAFELRDKLPEPASIVLTALSGVYFERFQLAQARQLLERATEVNPNPTSANEPVTVGILRAKIQSAQGDNKAALATIQAIRELHAHRPSSFWLDQDLIAYQALYYSRQGDLASAERMLMLSEAEAIKARPFSALIRAGVLMAQERNVEAEGILRHLLNQYPHGYYWWPILKARVRLSIALFDQHKVNQARQVMAEAARIAAPEFFLRPFLVSGPKIASLLSLVLHTENLNAETRSFLKGILTMVGYADGVQIILPRDESVAVAIAASITPREQQVLRLLSASLSNREIAEQCFISPSTVKTHLENIYRKLGVNSRTQAVEQALMLNLV